MDTHHRRIRDHPCHLDMGAILGATPIQERVGFPLRDELEPVRQRVGGVSFKHILSVVKPLSLAKFVLFKSFDDYTTNLPLEACDDRDVLLTYKWNGKPLTKEHGGPVRMIVPKRYAWKGAKWVKEITFSDKDEKGFWEVRGYSNSAFPWENDRYG